MTECRYSIFAPDAARRGTGAVIQRLPAADDDALAECPTP